MLLGLPQGRLRREIVGYWGREAAAGSFSRGDYVRVVKGLTTPDFKGRPAPELAALLGHGEEVLDRAAFLRFLEEWRTGWHEPTVTPVEIIDFGDRILLLNAVMGRAPVSGLELTRNEAQLYEFRDGQCFRWQQWWSWDEALKAVGLPE